jgi:uncharacterized membrane protein
MLSDQELENQTHKIEQDFRRLFLIPAVVVGLILGLTTTLVVFPLLVLLFSFSISLGVLIDLGLSVFIGFLAGRLFWLSTRI